MSKTKLIHETNHLKSVGPTVRSWRVNDMILQARGPWLQNGKTNVKCQDQELLAVAVSFAVNVFRTFVDAYLSGELYTCSG